MNGIPTIARYLLLVAGLLALQLSGSNYLLNLANFVALQALPAIGLSLLMGYTGQISIGHAAFYGLGAFGSVLIATHAGINPWVAIIITVAAVGLVGWALGWLVFRLEGHYLAMATLGFGIIVHVCLVEFDKWTGGPNGLTGIEPLTILGRQFYTDKEIFPLLWAVCILMIFLADNLVRSPLGLTMRGVAENGKVVASLGLSPDRIKRIVLMISAVYAAIAGAFYARYIGYISPEPFDVGFSVKLLLMVAIGGFAQIWGVLFGVAFVSLVSEVLKPLGGYDTVVFGVLLVVAVIYCRNGLLDAIWSVVLRLAATARRRAA